MIYSLNFILDFAKDTVGGTILSAVRWIFFVIDEFIYKLIINLYDIFILLCHGKLLDSSVLNELFGRIGVLLGLVMFLYVAFSFVQVLIDPDSFNDKQKGIPNLIKKCILVIIMFGVSSYVFNLLHNVQSAILNEDVISKFILPGEVDSGVFGKKLSADLFLSFYTIKGEVVGEDADDADLSWCSDQTEDGAIYLFRKDIINDGDFSIGYDCLDAKGQIVLDEETQRTGESFVIEFNFLFATIVGVIICWLILSYCISVGVRIIQLAVLQIISPMAFVSYLSPKQDTMFSKWAKMYISTYIDVFIRIAIINFVVYLCGLILDSWHSGNSVFWDSLKDQAGNLPSGSTKFFIGILMIIALLVFAKKAPELIKQLFPQGSSGLGFGISSPKKFLSDNPMVARGFGAAAVGAATMGGNLRKGIGKTVDSLAKGDYADAGKWALRSTFGSLASGVGGVTRGIRTTDSSGRKNATANAIARTQAVYKTRDAGYGSSIPGLLTKSGRSGAMNYLSDLPRRAFQRDQRIEEMAEGSDLQVESLQQHLRELQSNYSGDFTVQRSKLSDGYIVMNKNGERINIDEERDDNFVWTKDQVETLAHGDVAIKIADTSASLGKAQGKNKALHQKANEQKQGNGKG